MILPMRRSPYKTTHAVTLCWYAKTPRGWRYFVALTEKFHGATQVRHGWVMDRGTTVEYPTGKYVLRSHRDGQRIYEPLDTCNPRDAIHHLERVRRAAKAASDVGVNRNIIHKAAPAYIADLRAQGHTEAATQAKRVLDDFLPHTKGTDETRYITREMILAFHAHLRRKGNAPRTVFNKDVRLRSWLRWCKVPLEFMPAKPRYESTVPEMYSPSELKAILDAADAHMGIALRLALMLGLREQEIVYALWQNIDWHHATYTVKGSPAHGFAVKDSAQRQIPISAPLLSLLKEWRKGRKTTTLIVGTRSDMPELHLLRRLKRLAKRAGLNCGECGCEESGECERWYLHKFRSNFITAMLRATDARTAQMLAGHESLETTLTYLVPASGQELQQAANAVKWTD